MELLSQNFSSGAAVALAIVRG